MVRTMRECLTAWLQPDGTIEPKNSTSFLQLKEQEDVKNSKVIVDYEQNVDYEPEGADPNDKPVTREEEEEHSNADFAKMELLARGLSDKG